MHVVVVSICYPPEIRSVSTMVQELSEALVVRGDTVTVLTSWPQYNLSVEQKKAEFTLDSVENGVRIIRIKTLPTHKVNYIVRGIGQALLPVLFIRALKRHISDPIDAVVVYSPHLPLVKVGSYIKNTHGAQFLLNIQDIFPQNAIDLGILKNKILIRYFEKMESNAYHTADVITTCTEGARDFLIQHKGVDAEKVHVLHNWIDIPIYANAKAEGHFRERYQLNNKFVIIFPGILGPSQGLEFVIEVARKLQDLTDLLFLFVGNGTEKGKLEAMVVEHRLHNVHFEEFVALDQYPRLLKEMDMGLLSLEKDSKTPTIPGKFFGFAAARLPMVAFLNPESEGHRIIRDARCGVALVSDNAQAAADCIRSAYLNKTLLDQWAQNGYDYVTKHFSKMEGIRAFEKLLSV